MNWLFPGFLVGALAIALPIVLHFLRRQPKRRIVFPSLRFLAVATQRTERRHRLLRLLVLLLRCAAFGLLAAAFARPFFSESALRGGKTIVVVVDNTFSVQAQGRWEKLRDWARAQIGSLKPEDKLGLLLMAPRPTWLIRPTVETGPVFDKLMHLEPGWQTGRAESALRFAADALGAFGGGEARIIFLGDHQQLSWNGTDFSKPLPPGLSVVFPPVPEPVSRQAALSAPSLTRTERGIKGAVSIRNFTGKQTRQLRIFRDAETTPVFDKTVELGEHETISVDVDLPSGTAGFARFRFALDPDDLPADDTAYAVLQAGPENEVLLDPAPLGSEADYVGAALGSTAAVKPALRVSPIPAGSWPSNTVAVLRNDSSFAGATATRLETFLRDGGSALVFVNGGGAQEKWFLANGRITLRPAKAEDKSLVVHEWTMDHPIVAAMSEHEVGPLLGWAFRQGWDLPLEAVEPLALWSENQGAIGEIKVGAGRILVCGFVPDRRAGDWPLHAAFVPFLHRTVAYLLGAEAVSTTAAEKVGGSVRLPANSGTWRALDGPASGKPATNVTGSITPSEPGVYEFIGKGEKKLFAVNLAPEESDPALWTEGKPWFGLVSTKTTTSAHVQPHFELAAFDAEQGSSLWWWLLAAASVLLLLELGLANRTAR